MSIFCFGFYNRNGDVLSNEQNIIRAQAFLAGVYVSDRHNPSRRQDQLLCDGFIFPASRLEFWKYIGAAGVGFVHVPWCYKLTILQKLENGRISLKNDNPLQG